MIIKKQLRRRVIDLTGPEGNAYVLLSIGKQLAKHLSLDWESIQKKMTLGDYDNLIAVFDKHFGKYVDLER